MTYSAAQIAAILGVTRQAVQKRATKGCWPSIKVPGRGRARLFALSDLPVDIRKALLTAGQQASRKALKQADREEALRAKGVRMQMRRLILAAEALSIEIEALKSVIGD
jgi:hypothetical protein